MEANTATAAGSKEISELESQLALVYGEKLNLEEELAASMEEITSLHGCGTKIVLALAGLQADYDALQLAIAHAKIQDLEVGLNWTGVLIYVCSLDFDIDRVTEAIISYFVSVYPHFIPLGAICFRATEACTNETINSLKFGAQVNACHIGTAIKNTA